MRQQSLIASLFLASAASAISQSDRGQPGHSFAKETVVCKELDFKVTAGATNVLFNITAPSTQADFAAALNAILTGQLNPVGGTKNVAPATYKIHGQYCSPAACDKTKRTSDKKRENAIQVIHHSALEQGITEFDIKVKPDIYSYQRQAAESGLSTLVIERLGSGQSDIPEDGINLVQSPLHVEMFHQIVKGVKDGTLLGKKFSTVIGVGHSYGASLINQHTVAYPSDFHSVILLGYSHVLNPTFPALLNLTQAPSKGTNLPNLNKAFNSYLVHATIQDRINAFYTVGNFDQAILEYDNANEGIFTIGEILTLQSNQVTAPKFSGNVAYFNGQEDVGFGIKDLNDEKPFWPKAKSISFNTYPKTGHGILAHLNAKQVQKDINAFVAKVL